MVYTVITGASSGIGYATAQKFASEGKSLILIARREKRLKRLQTELTEAFPDIDVVIKPFDLGQTEALEDFFEDLTSQFKIDTWINNAGFGLFSSVKEQDLDTIDQMVDVNIKALLHLSTLFVKTYQDTAGTQLLNVSSGAGYNLYPNCVTYTASKAFVSSFTENLAHELRSKKAKMVVKLVVPEATETEFINVAANRSETIDYSSEFTNYTTSQEMANDIWSLYNSSFIVGQVDDETYEFFGHNGHFPYKDEK